MAFNSGPGGFRDPGQDPSYAQSQPKAVTMSNPTTTPLAGGSGGGAIKTDPSQDANGGVSEMAKFATGGGGTAASSGGGSSMGDPTGGGGSSL